MNKKNNLKIPRPIALVIINGWDIQGEASREVINEKNTPFFREACRAYPSAVLSSESGLIGQKHSQPASRQIYSLIGLGRPDFDSQENAGRIIKTLSKNPVFHESVKHVIDRGGTMHLAGLLSESVSCASFDHLKKIIHAYKDAGIKDLALHLFLDGRETPGDRGAPLVKNCLNFLSAVKFGRIASLSGSFYALDDTGHWERTARTYRVMHGGRDKTAVNALSAIESSYGKNIYDEEFVPRAFGPGIKNGDALFFFHYRPGGISQLARAFAEKEFSFFPRSRTQDLFLSALSDYGAGTPERILCSRDNGDSGLSGLIAAAGLNQLKLAGTEGFPLVTYYFNGGRTEPHPGEDWRLIASEDKENRPGALEETRKISEAAADAISSDKYDFIVINFNPFAGVNGGEDISALKKAAKETDRSLKRIAALINSGPGLLVLSAAKGIGDRESGGVTEPMNKIPLVLISRAYESYNLGWPDAPDGDLDLAESAGNLLDIAPTILSLYKLAKPKEMIGRSLVL